MSVPLGGMEQLLAAARKNKMRQQELVGLDEQAGRADALRGQAAPTGDKYGYISPLAVIANTIDKSRGRMDTRNLDIQKEATRGDIGNYEGQLEANVLQQAMAKRAEGAAKAQREADQFVTDEEQRIVENERAVTEEERKQQEQERKERERAGKSLVYTDGKKGKMAVTTDADGNLVQAAGPNRGKPIPEGWYEDETSSYGGYGQRGKAFSQNDIVKLNKEIQSVSNLRQNKDSFEDRFAKPAGVPTQTAQKIVGALAAGDIMSEIPGTEALDERTKASLQWFANWRMDFTTEKRHELFGATLTTNEDKAWKAAELIHPGMDPAEIRKRIDALESRANENMLRRLNMSAASGPAANSEVIRRAAEGLYGYDAENNSFGMLPVDPEVAAAEAAAAEAEANWVPPPGLADFYAALGEEDKAGILAIKDPNVRAQVLQSMKNPPVEEAPSVLPKARRGRYGG